MTTRPPMIGTPPFFIERSDEHDRRIIGYTMDAHKASEVVHKRNKIAWEANGHVRIYGKTVEDVQDAARNTLFTMDGCPVIGRVTYSCVGMRCFDV